VGNLPISHSRHALLPNNREFIGKERKTNEKWQEVMRGILTGQRIARLEVVTIVGRQ
jgi:hypothetical protein